VLQEVQVGEQVLERKQGPEREQKLEVRNVDL
jgi:hypothetical protein